MSLDTRLWLEAGWHLRLSSLRLVGCEGVHMVWQPDPAQVTARCSQLAAVVGAQAAWQLLPPVLCTCSLCSIACSAGTHASAVAEADAGECGRMTISRALCGIARTRC